MFAFSLISVCFFLQAATPKETVNKSNLRLKVTKNGPPMLGGSKTKARGKVEER